MPTRTAQVNLARATRVYVIGDARGFSKIGASSNPKRRVSQLQVGSPSGLVLAGEVRCGAGRAMAVERACHVLLRELRVSGEWFNVKPKVAMAAVTCLATGREADALIVLELAKTEAACDRLNNIILGMSGPRTAARREAYQDEAEGHYKIHGELMRELSSRGVMRDVAGEFLDRLGTGARWENWESV